MPKEDELTELISLLEKLSVTVKYHSGNFRGGLVRYDNKNIFYLNRKADPEVKINNILSELKQMKIPEELMTNTIHTLLADFDGQ